MSRPPSGNLKITSRTALKSPLRTATMAGFGPSPAPAEPADPSPDAAARAQEISAAQLRQMQISGRTGSARAKQLPARIQAI
jgi:hypothetical protein